MTAQLSIRLIILALLACLPASSLASEVLRPGDYVTVTVFGHADLTSKVRISDDGYINMPLINRVRIADMGLQNAEERIADILSRQNIVRDPRVTVRLEDRGTKTGAVATIVGHVKRSGRYFVVEDESTSETEGVLEGASTVVELLALAGGLAEGAGNRLILSRGVDGKETSFKVDLDTLIGAGDMSQNFALRAGDKVLVPRMEEFYVYGEVRRPGRYRLEPGMTALQGLSVAGGLTERGTEKGLSLRRTQSDGKIINARVKLDDKLSAGDVVYVRKGIF